MRKERLKKENIIENQMKCCNSHEQAITLIALVVTIVVLLILASVSISLVLGQNGLINNAKEAKNKTLEAEKTEGESLNTASDYIKQTVGVTASGITVDDYGKVVTNYQEGSNVWEIFYADDNNVYLITRNNVGSRTLEIATQENSGYNGTSDFDGSENFRIKYPAVQNGWLKAIYTKNEGIKYESNYNNMKCVEYLLDSSIWNEKYKTERAEWAIGGPTMELLVASYSKYSKTEITIKEIEGTGYENTINEGLTIEKANGVYNHGFTYWLSCASNVNPNILNTVEYKEGCVNSNAYNTGEFGIRPVICLNSSVILKESSDGTTYTIEKIKKQLVFVTGCLFL